LCTIKKGNIIMKTLLSSAALVAVMASGASAAGYTHWVGDTTNNNFNPGCTFTTNENGVYTYDESTKTWTVTNPADVTIEVRNSPTVTVGYIQVDPVNKAGDTVGGTVWSTTDEWTADVLYTGSVITKPSPWDQPAPTGNYNKIYLEDTGSFAGVNPTSGIVDIDIDGTATITGFGTNEIIDANTEYRTSHMITCMQAPVSAGEAVYFGAEGDAATGGN
jgi:hypothetical protein